MLDERTGEILAAAIREFIRTGEPVSSGLLYDRYKFGIKPAMIRLILKDLDDDGYLAQPNYSAGRIPSDRGYEFFADYVLRETEPASPSKELMEPFERHEWPQLLLEMSRELGVLSVAASMAARETYKAGLELLIDRLDWDSRAELKAVIRDFEALDERINECRQDLMRAQDEVQIFVGKKSPVTRCGYLSVVSGEFDADGEPMLLLAIGPKRMDYQKTAKMFKNLKVANKKKQQ